MAVKRGAQGDTPTGDGRDSPFGDGEGDVAHNPNGEVPGDLKGTQVGKSHQSEGGPWKGLDTAATQAGGTADAEVAGDIGDTGVDACVRAEGGKKSVFRP